MITKYSLKSLPLDVLSGLFYMISVGWFLVGLFALGMSLYFYAFDREVFHDDYGIGAVFFICITFGGSIMLWKLAKFFSKVQSVNSQTYKFSQSNKTPNNKS